MRQSMRLVLLVAIVIYCFLWVALFQRTQLSLCLQSLAFSIVFSSSDNNSIFRNGVLEDRYILDTLCRSCRQAKATETLRCGASIPEATTIHRNDHLVQAIRQRGIDISRQYPHTCAQCHPDQCASAAKRFWRYDRVGLDIQRTTNLQLNSVPSIHRLPPEATHNITDYLLTSYPDRVYPTREYLFDYNPSIVQLSTPVKRAHYLASFRVSNQHYCLHPEERQLMNGVVRSDGSRDSSQSRPPAQNWLGLAWLDEHLRTVQDMVLDVRPVGFPAAEDYRLVRLGDGIYLTSYDQIAQLYFQERSDAVPIPQAYPNVSAPTVYLRNFASCAPCRRSTKRGLCGKNFNYVALAPNEAAVEIWPSPPHLVRKVNLTQPCDRSVEPEEFVDAASTVRPSFATVEEVLFPHLPPEASLLTRGRGGACCVPWVDPRTQQPLWVGVLHSKTPSQGNRHRVANVTANHYLSQLYAFEQSAPFNLVALSGFFCLGFHGGADSDHHLARLSSWRQLELGMKFNCPRIHFVSGITTKSGDPSTIILALGVNDCYSLFFGSFRALDHRFALQGATDLILGNQWSVHVFHHDAESVFRASCSGG